MTIRISITHSVLPWTLVATCLHDEQRIRKRSKSFINWSKWGPALTTVKLYQHIHLQTVTQLVQYNPSLIYQVVCSVLPNTCIFGKILLFTILPPLQSHVWAGNWLFQLWTISVWEFINRFFYIVLLLLNLDPICFNWSRIYSVFGFSVRHGGMWGKQSFWREFGVTRGEWLIYRWSFCGWSIPLSCQWAVVIKDIFYKHKH